MEAGIGLGSNLGDRLATLAAARDRLARLPGLRLLAASRVYETAPVDVPERYRNLPFLNAVAVFECALAVRDLAAGLKRLEAELGRVRSADRNAPRTIDLDILYAGAETVRDPDLVIPHARWAERLFVVRPLADVRPELRLPGSALTVREVLARLPDEGVSLFAEAW